VLEELLGKKKKAAKTIVYTSTVSGAKHILVWLRGKLPNLGRVPFDDGSFEYNVDMFTGVTPTDTKQRIMNEFAKEDSYITVLVATIAFGMGINISNLYQVVVYDVSNEPSSLMQMVGRCSRDGSKGRACILLPIAPQADSLDFELANSCARRALNSKFYGWVEPLPSQETFNHSQCVPHSCNCDLCTCCSFCKKSCVCSPKV